MGHTIIEVPAMAGDPNHPAAAGPATITAALHDTGCELPVHRVAVEASGGEMVRASIELGTQVKELVRAIVASGNVPVVLAGSCDVAPAVLAGIQCPRVGVIWIDAHADFNTPQSSFSGFWPGMTLAVVVGDCGQHVWSALGSDPVAPERVLLVGVRSLTPEEEARRLRQSAIRVVPWQGGLPQGDVEAALEALRDEVELVYVHLDLDALDPTIGKGVVDQPVAGGLSSSQLAELLDTVRKRCTVVAATVATYTPDKDDGSTLAVAVASINRLIDRPPGSGA